MATFDLQIEGTDCVPFARKTEEGATANEAMVAKHETVRLQLKSFARCPATPFSLDSRL